MYRKGEKVQIRDTEAARERHRRWPRYFPAPGTVGEVVSARPRDSDILVQWPKGSTGGHDKWFVLKELVKRAPMESRKEI